MSSLRLRCAHFTGILEVEAEERAWAESLERVPTAYLPGWAR